MVRGGADGVVSSCVVRVHRDLYLPRLRERIRAEITRATANLPLQNLQAKCHGSCPRNSPRLRRFHVCAQDLRAGG